MATLERTAKSNNSSAEQREPRHPTQHVQQGHDSSAAGTAGSAVDQTWQLASRAKDEAKEYIGSRKEGFASMLNDVAEATRQAAGFLSDRSDSTAARYVSSAADRADELSNYVRNHEPTELINDLKQVARRSPVAVCGGLFAVGLIMSRFLRSSEPGTGPQ